MEEIIESRLNYLSVDELDEFKFLPVIPINISWHTGMSSWVLRLEDGKTKTSKNIYKVLKVWYEDCIKHKKPFI